MSDWFTPGPATSSGPVRVWTMTRNGRTATCDAVRHPLGLELVVSIGDDIRRTEAFRLPAQAQTTADEWRRSFLDFGWVNVPGTEPAH